MSQLVPPIQITLDRPRSLVTDFNAIAAIKRFCGVNLFEGQQPLGKVVEVERDGVKLRGIAADPENLRCVLAALLLEEDPLMTPDKAGKLINALNLSDVITKCGESLFSFFPDKKESSDPLAGTPAPETPST